jgi:hypothetical protein
MANILPKILSKSSTRNDLIECIETCIKTSLLSAPNLEESLIMDAMTEYISVRYLITCIQCLLLKIIRGPDLSQKITWNL